MPQPAQPPTPAPPSTPTPTTPPPAPTPGTNVSSKCQVGPINTKRQKLLASKDRVGFGRNTTGGTNVVEVRNFNELATAIQTAGNYVLLDASLKNKGIGFPQPIFPAPNTTLDGSNAPGAYFFPDYSQGYPPNQPMISTWRNQSTGVEAQNFIFHCLTLDGKRSRNYDANHPSYNVGGLHIRQGRNIWIDHVEITEFWDDAILVGFASNLTGDDVTVSNTRMYNTDKGLGCFYREGSPRGSGRISILNTELSGKQRNPWCLGGENVHIWNSYIHDTRFNDANHVNSNQGSKAVVNMHLSESNHYENNPRAEWAAVKNIPAGAQSWMYIDGKSVYRNNKVNIFGNVVLKNSGKGPGPFAIDYPYTLMNANQVKSYVQSNAGAVW